MRHPNGFGSIDKLSGKRRKPYRVRVTTGFEMDDDGHARQIQRTVGTYATYQEAVDALAAYNRNPVILDPSVTFGEVYRRWSAEKYPSMSESTANTYASAYAAISEILGNAEFRKLRRANLQDAVELSGREYPTLQIILVVIRGVYKYAIRNDIIDKDYSQYLNISRFKPDEDGEPMHKIFTSEEMSALWDHKDDQFVREILMLCYSGLRIAEYLALTPEDIDVPARFLTVRKAKTRSGIRHVPIAEKTAALWEELRERRKTPDARRLKAQYDKFADVMTAKMEQIGLDRHLPHDTRHTCASMLKEQKVDLLVIKRILGHRINDMTERVYIDLTDTALLEAINRL
ncbi:MAG: site-specific integrase [Lachnospiraceae bacterium]|nr:site-specific integrase [Lachnospiraceae bacterium]